MVKSYLCEFGSVGGWGGGGWTAILNYFQSTNVQKTRVFASHVLNRRSYGFVAKYKVVRNEILHIFCILRFSLTLKVQKL